MVWSCIGLLLVTITTSTHSASSSKPAEAPPLSGEEIRLLQAAEALAAKIGSSATSTDTNAFHGEGEGRGRVPLVESTPKHYVPSHRRGINVSEDFSLTMLPLRFIRQGPGNLSSSYQGLQGRRLVHQVDGFSVHHLFDPFDETGRFDLFDAQNISQIGVGHNGLQLRRRSPSYSTDSGSKFRREVWAQGGSFLRDGQLGIELSRSLPSSAWSTQIALSRPSTGYFSSGQTTKRRNASYRAMIKSGSSENVNVEIGADFDQLSDVVRWDLDAQGRTIDQVLERLGAFTKMKWHQERWASEVSLYHFQHRSQRENSFLPQASHQHSSLQFGAELLLTHIFSNYFTLTGVAGYRGEQGQRQTKQSTVRGTEGDIQAQAELGIHWGREPKNISHKIQARASQLLLKAGLIQQIRAIDDARFVDTHWRTQISLRHRFSPAFEWRTEANYRQNTPNVGDFVLLADPGLESLWALNGGPEIHFQDLVFRIFGFGQWLKNPMVRSWEGDQIIRGTNQFITGCSAYARWDWTSSLGLESIFTWQKNQYPSTDDYFGRVLLHYIYWPREIYFEANLNQYSINMFSFGAHFRMPLGDFFSTQITVDNILDMNTMRPKSSIPEPELNVRALIRAHL